MVFSYLFLFFLYGHVLLFLCRFGVAQGGLRRDMRRIYICDFAMGLRWAMRQPFLTRVKFLTQLLRLSMVFACFMYILVGQQTRARQAGGSRRAFPAPEAMRRICARPFF